MKQAKNVVRAMLCTVAALVAGTPAFGQATRQSVVVAPAAPAPIQGFSVVLVLGSLKPSAETFAAELPRGATRALADMTDFLPYRSYRLLDSAWILNPGSGRVTSRLRGTDNRDYDVNLVTSLAPTSSLTVKFTLREGGANRTASPDNDRQAARDGTAILELQAELKAEAAHLTSVIPILEAELVALLKQLNAAHPDVMRKQVQMDDVRRRLEVLKARQNRASAETAAASSLIIDTGFTMNVGETVVVGTSRLQGDTALIVLLTAVPRGSK
jgi:hypothetical protein